MGAPAYDRPTIRVVSYNVHGLRGDQAALTRVITALAPDIVVVQEAPRRWRWRRRCADLAYRLGLVHAAGGQPSLGNLVLVSLRVAVEHTWCARFPLTPGRHLRGAVVATCSVGPVAFAVAGSHLSTDAAERAGQARRLAALLAEIGPPLVLAGDVNDTEGSPAWATLAAGRIDTAHAAVGSPAATYPSAAPRRRLDAIFVDPRVDVLGYQVVDSALARRASDHLPVVADLALPASPR